MEPFWINRCIQRRSNDWICGIGGEAEGEIWDLDAAPPEKMHICFGDFLSSCFYGGKLHIFCTTWQMSYLPLKTVFVLIECIFICTWYSGLAVKNKECSGNWALLIFWCCKKCWTTNCPLFLLRLERNVIWIMLQVWVMCCKQKLTLLHK